MNAREMPTPDADTSIATLANGVRVVAIELPHLASACVSVFVRTGSASEGALAGFSFASSSSYAMVPFSVR